MAERNQIRVPFECRTQEDVADFLTEARQVLEDGIANGLVFTWEIIAGIRDVPYHDPKDYRLREWDGTVEMRIVATKPPRPPQE